MNTEIRTLADDELIKEPGFYAISLDRHHSQPCDGPSVTSGVLRKMELATPADVWAFHQLNPDRWEKKETAALKLGRAMAAYVEGGAPAVEQEYLIVPDDAPRRPTQPMLDEYAEKKLNDFARIRAIPAGAPKAPLSSVMRKYQTGDLKDQSAEWKACKFWDDMQKDPFTYYSEKDHAKLVELRDRVDFWTAHDADLRDKLQPAQYKMICDMGAVLAKDVGAKAAMGGIPEVTMAWRDEETGLWLLARPDTVNFDGTVTDYKKMNTMGGSFTYRLVDQRITDHGYDMQLAFAAEVFENLTKNWPEIAAIVAQWDLAPHHVILREISQEDLRIGQFRNRRAIRRFAECLASGDWPGPGADVAAYQRPDWQRDMLMAQMNTEGTEL